MKCLFIFVICSIQLFLTAQDTIYKRDGNVIPAKVLEINIKEVSYKRSDLSDGPLFIINKNEIQKIKYATGTIDSFKVVKDAPKKQNVVIVNQDYIPLNYNLITPSLRRGTYQYMGHRISDRNVLLMALKKNQVWKNQEIELNSINCKRNKMMQYSIGYGGAIVGGIGLYASALGVDIATNGSEVAFLGAMLSAGVVVSSQIVSFTYKLKRVKHANRVAELYNQLSKN